MQFAYHLFPVIWHWLRKEVNVLFNDALNTFYLRLYIIGHMVAREETHCRHMGYSFRLAVRVLLYAPSHRQSFITPVVERWLEHMVKDHGDNEWKPAVKTSWAILF